MEIPLPHPGAPPTVYEVQVPGAAEEAGAVAGEEVLVAMMTTKTLAFACGATAHLLADTVSPLQGSTVSSFRPRAAAQGIAVPASGLPTSAGVAVVDANPIHGTSMT